MAKAKTQAPAAPEAPKAERSTEQRTLSVRRNDSDALKGVTDILMGADSPSEPPHSPKSENEGGDTRKAEKPPQRPSEDVDDLYGDGKPAGKPEAEAEDSEEEEKPRREGAKPKTFSEAAEALGMEPKDLYSLTLTTGDGDEVKIGDLKDAYQDRQAAERETAQRAAALDERETALFQQQRLFAELGDELASTLTPQKRQELMSHMQEQEARERRLLMTAMPELADQAHFDTFRDDVVQTLGKYGYSPHEIVVSDHRHLLVVRDLIRANKRIRSLLSMPKDQQKPPKASAPQGRGAGSQNRRKAQTTGQHRTDGQVAAVASLLKD